MLYNSTMKGKLIFVGLNPSRVPISKSKGSSYKRFHTWLDYLELDYVSFTNLSSDPNWDFKYKSFDAEGTTSNFKTDEYFLDDPILKKLKLNKNIF